MNNNDAYGYDETNKLFNQRNEENQKQLKQVAEIYERMVNTERPVRVSQKQITAEKFRKAGERALAIAGVVVTLAAGAVMYDAAVHTDRFATTDENFEPGKTFQTEQQIIENVKDTAQGVKDTYNDINDAIEEEISRGGR